MNFHNKELSNCCKQGNTKHKPAFNCLQAGINLKAAKSMDISKVSVLILARRLKPIYTLLIPGKYSKLKSFSQSLFATQSFIQDCPIDNDSSETFFICQIQQGKGHQKAIAVSYNTKKRLYLDLPVLHIQTIESLHT